MSDAPREKQKTTEGVLLAAWHKLAGERRALQHDVRRHGANTVARQRLMRLDSVLSGKLLAIGDELRARGIDPNRRGRPYTVEDAMADKQAARDGYRP